MSKGGRRQSGRLARYRKSAFVAGRIGSSSNNLIPQYGRTYLVNKGTSRRAPVHVGADDRSLTGRAGLLLSGELVHRLELVGRLDSAVNAVREFKQRQRGRSAGGLLVSLAEMILLGGNHLAHPEMLRQDAASSEEWGVAATPPPSTAGQLHCRLTRRQWRLWLRLGSGPAAELCTIRDQVIAPFMITNSYVTQLCSWSERTRVLAAELLRGRAAPQRSAMALVFYYIGYWSGSHWTGTAITEDAAAPGLG